MAEKDWKAEYDKLRGQLIAVQKELERAYEREERRRNEEAERRDDARRLFKDLFIDVLGR